MDIDIFKYDTKKGLRDNKMKELLSELIEEGKKMDVNYLMLTFDKYRKELYRIQRKLIRIEGNDSYGIGINIILYDSIFCLDVW